MPMLNTGVNNKTDLTEIKSQLNQIESEKYDKVTLYENELKFYANEVELTSIKLPASEGSGQNAREIELQKSETHIQWRYIGEEVWKDLVALNDIKGDAGVKGDKGDRGLPISVNLNGISYTHQDGVITLPNYPNKTSDLENDVGFITAADIDTTQNHIHTNKSSLDKITEQKLTSWDGKSDFSGSYNDLTDKPNIPSVAGLATESYVNTKVAGIVDSAPETLDTLKELSEALGNDPNFATTVANQIGTKADKSHNHNTDYASKSSEHNHANKIILDAIDDSKIANWNDAYTHSQIAHDYAPASHTSDNIAHITADERTKWNNKSDLALGTTSSTAFRGDQGLIAYNHSQVAHAPANAEQNVQADWNEVNTSSDAYIKNKPTIPTVDVNKAYVDGELNKKADKTSLHNHNNKEVLDTIDTSKITQWDKAIIFEESGIDDANTWLTNGYTKTKDSTTNLPPQCDTTTDRWGVLQFVKESDQDTGTQIFYPIDGKFKGRVFVRSVVKRTTNAWTLLSTFSGSYNDLTDIPSSFTPVSHRHNASEIDNLPSGGSIDFGANNNWTGTNTFTNLVKIIGNNEVQRMEPATANNACYYAFYKDKQSRSGYFGYGSAYNNTFVIGNDVNDADVNVETKGAGKLKTNGHEVATIAYVDNLIGTINTQLENIRNGVLE